ncbi:MAG: hypothetical protein ACFFDP_05040 [Promethearchaeota archaeon]
MKNKSKNYTLASILIVIPIILILVIYFLWLNFSNPFYCPLSYYPGQFEYNENVYVDSPEEEAALTVVDNFNFSTLPAYPLYTSPFTYLSRSRLDAIAAELANFDPYAHCGYERYNYSANVTLCATLNLTMSHAWQLHPENNPLTIKSNGTTLFPYTYPDWYQVYHWLGGYWNGTAYEAFNQPQQLNYTNVFLVDIQLSYSYYSNPLAAGKELECQEVIVDNTGYILFVYWLMLMGPVA